MKPFILLFCIIFSLVLNAHTLPLLERQVLVRVKPENSHRDYLAKLFPNEKIEISVESFQLWKISFSDSIPFSYIRQQITEGKILSYTRNRALQSRSTTPNDPLFSQQWHHLNNFNPGQNVTYGINSICAWDNRKDITTLQGDTIVVAALDFGFDTFHEDIDYFINRNEIPHDSIDNDNNGAIDDYRGWNAGSNNSDITKGGDRSHGMRVVGAIAAKGNNNIGVSGVTWNAKILPIAEIGTIEWSIKAIEYCIKLKRLYWSSNKQKGAYIVALNYSLGTTGFLPDEEPLWCAAYDSLGNVGILATCAVDHTYKDVSIYQDMPILCNSPYQINVTTYDKFNLAVEGHGYSTQYVHLAAPHYFHTTWNDNKYGNSNSGSSFATPLVAGTIALMYSSFDAKFLDTLHKNPKLVSLKIKSTILQQVDITDSLKTKVMSKGKLNVCKTITQSKTLQDSFYPRSGNAVITSENIPINLYSYDQYLVVEKEQTKIITLSLFNLMGKEIGNYTITNSYTQIDLNHLPKGIYFATYNLKNQFYSEKIVLR